MKSDRLEDHETRPQSRFVARREGIGLVAILFFVGCLYFYIGIPPLYNVKFEADRFDYYNQLTDGFLSGRLGFKNDPPRELVALADPYDPVQRAAAGNVGAHDATYYKGRYYLYFGVAPAITLFLPFKVLTGLHFPQNLATVVFCFGGFLASLAFILGLRRRFFGGVGSGWVWCAAAVLGLGNLCLPMLARNSVWELPISSAYFFSMTGLALLLHSRSTNRRPLLWLVAASAAFGLAIASRPHFIFGVLALLGLWGLSLRRRWKIQGRGGLQSIAREVPAVLIPLGLIVGGLLIYNYQRFESPFEFGQKYQLAGNRQVDSQLLSFRFFPTNFYLNVVAPAQLGRYFPFIHVVRGYPGTRPVDYGGAENPYGVLVNLPITLVGVACAILWWKNRRRWGGIADWIAILGCLTIPVFVAVMCFAWSANRYIVDFLPGLLLLTCVGIFTLREQLRAMHVLVRRAGNSLLWVICGVTIVFNLLLAVQHNDLFSQYRPVTYSALARVFNRPALWWENFRGQPYGPVELAVQFPMDQPGKAEPLAVTGVGYKSDFFYVIYSPRTRQIRLAFNHTGGPQLLSQPITVDYLATHRLSIEAGSLYPAQDHPYFAGASSDEIKAIKRRLRVALNGVPYLVGDFDFYDTTPGFVTFGQNRISDYIGRHFTGEKLVAVRKSPEPFVNDFKKNAFLQLGLVMPSGAKESEPLISYGGVNGEDVLFVEYVGTDKLRFGFGRPGIDAIFSEPVEYVPSLTHLVEVSLGSFYQDPMTARELELAGLLVVRVDGRTVWQKAQEFTLTDGDPPAIGRLRAPRVGLKQEFSGTVISVQSTQPFPSAPLSPFRVDPYWRETGFDPSYGAARVHFKLPPVRPPGLEPFLVTGATDALADYLFINHAPPGRLLMGYIHAAVSGPQSIAVSIDPTKTHVVEIDIPSLYPSESGDYFTHVPLRDIESVKVSRATVRLNDRTLFSRPVNWFDSKSRDIVFGTNRYQQAYGAKFSGEIVAIERRVFTPPEGLVESAGPLLMTIHFPSDPKSGSTETLLATGAGETFDALTVVYSRPGWAHLRFIPAGGAGVTSSEFALPGRPLEVSIEWGGLNILSNEAVGSEDALVESDEVVQVTVAGAVVLSAQSKFTFGRPQRVVFGGASAFAGRFSGRLVSIRRADKKNEDHSTVSELKR